MEQNYKKNHTVTLYSAEIISFVASLHSCSKNRDLCAGMLIHHEILKLGLLDECLDALISMYARCGALKRAMELISMHSIRNVYTWTVLIAEHAHQGHARDALDCFEGMQRQGVIADGVTYATVLNACAKVKAFEKGIEIHDEVNRLGLLDNDVILGNALVDMYSKCGALAKAQHVLEGLCIQDVFAWNSLIVGYTQQGQGQQALDCFKKMQSKGCSPDARTYTSVLKACALVGNIELGEHIHKEIARTSLLRTDMVLGTALLNMYAKCGAVSKAEQVFNDLPSCDMVCWNALITGYVQHGQPKQALHCFEEMQNKGLVPNELTFTFALKACGMLGAADKGEEIHEIIAKQGLLDHDIVLGTVLVDMYAKCGALTKARCVLDDLSSKSNLPWNALIGGYVQYGLATEALNCIAEMQQEGLSPDPITFSFALKASAALGALDKGIKFHDEISKQGMLGSNIQLDNALVDMYAKCGALIQAQEVLEKLPIRDSVSWSAVIAGFVDQGQGEQALHLFDQMRHDGLLPDSVIFSCILKACGNMGAISRGEQIHDEICKLGLLKNDVVLGNSLIDMYAKCGALFKAKQVLEDLPSQDVVSWNSLIGGFAQQGQCKEALECLKQMEQKGISVNALTFSYVLYACTHLGLVEDGHMHFVNMSTKYGLQPTLEHYTCMIELWGRAGYLDKAVSMIQGMPSFSDTYEIWYSLLGACQEWGDLNIGRWAFQHAIRIDKTIASAYVLMANIYATAGMQKEAEIIEALREENKASKYSHDTWS
ncbi:hypothetical protein KP509_04G048900 [Ceratopteris richardii]|nr:hypothetical protein KP509_04G048900 [Ceratopteris richardii]